MFLQQLVNGLVLGAIYALIALGYTLVYGILMMINFAHSEIFMMGAFMGLGALDLLPGKMGWGVAVVVFLAGMIGAGLLGVLTERFAYRPLRRASVLAPLISAIGVSIILQNAVFLWITDATVPFPQILAIRQFNLGAVSFTSQDLMIFLTAIGLMLALHFFIQKTKVGKAMRACSDSVETAGLMGIDANRIIALTFFVGGALGGAAGLLYGMNYGSIKYNLGFMPGVKAFTAAVLGGIGNIAGSVLGGFLLGLIEVMASAYLPGGNEWKDVFAFVVLICVLLIRPSGLLGEKVADKV